MKGVEKGGKETRKRESRRVEEDRKEGKEGW